MEPFFYSTHRISRELLATFQEASSSNNTRITNWLQQSSKGVKGSFVQHSLATADFVPSLVLDLE
jgi:hypothetical protein